LRKTAGELGSKFNVRDDNLLDMKKIIGLFILIIALALVSGCTQQTTTTPVTTVTATEVPTVIETTVETSVAPTEEATIIETPVETSSIDANVTAPVEVTASVTQAITAAMTPSTKVTVIHIANNSFSPATLMVLPGTGITWVNDDSTVHSVKTIGDNSPKFNSGDIVANVGRWGYTFSQKEGTIEYTDGYNLNVTGVIIVKKGDSFAGMGTPTTYTTSNSAW
jgi:plastocyanin